GGAPGAFEAWRVTWEQDGGNTNLREPGGARHPQCSTTAVTLISPRSAMRRAFAAASDKSRTRFLLNGPRSVTVTTTVRWVRASVTRRRVPNGRVRWAQVNLLGS